MIAAATLYFNRMPLERMGVLLAVLAATGFSMKAIFVKLAYSASAIDPITALSLRMLFALPLFLWIGRKVLKSGPPLSRSDWGMLLLLGLLGYYGASILDFMGLQYISAGLERLILFTYPTLTLMIGVLFMGHALRKSQVAAVVLSYIGIGIAFWHDLSFTENTSALLLGAALVFGSALSYALYSAGTEGMVRKIGSLRFAVLATLVSTGATQLHFIATQPISSLVQPVPVYVYCAAMGVFSTVLPVVWQTAAIRIIGSARTALIGTLGPVLSIVFAWALLAEPISVFQLIGAGFVLAGVYLVGRSKPNPQEGYTAR